VRTTDHDPTDDELLAIRCQLGEPAAFDDLIARWHAPLWLFVRRLVGEDDAAREILQDVWLRVIRGIPQLRDGSRLRAWLFGIARRTLMDGFREEYAQSPTVDIDVDDIAADAPTAEDAADLQGLMGALMIVIATGTLVHARRGVEQLAQAPPSNDGARSRRSRETHSWETRSTVRACS
jgi:DNA-directed RNA polymerase specialized sigma24 family protein